MLQICFFGWHPNVSKNNNFRRQHLLKRRRVYKGSKSKDIPASKFLVKKGKIIFLVVRGPEDGSGTMHCCVNRVHRVDNVLGWAAQEGCQISCSCWTGKVTIQIIFTCSTTSALWHIKWLSTPLPEIRKKKQESWGKIKQKTIFLSLHPNAGRGCIH